MKDNFLLVLFLLGAAGVGYAAASLNFADAIDRCDTEELKCQVQIEDDRAAYFRSLADCKGGN